jgi:hypothetical protein
MFVILRRAEVLQDCSELPQGMDPPRGGSMPEQRGDLCTVPIPRRALQLFSHWNCTATRCIPKTSSLTSPTREICAKPFRRLPRAFGLTNICWAAAASPSIAERPCAGRAVRYFPFRGGFLHPNPDSLCGQDRVKLHPARWNQDDQSCEEAFSTVGCKMGSPPSGQVPTIERAHE